MAEVHMENVGCGPMRTTDDRILRLRWKGGALQYMRHWSDGERQGHEWIDVPAEPADEDGVTGTLPGLTEEEREHIHQAIEMLGDYEATQRESGNDSTAAGASATRHVLQKLFRFMPGRNAGVEGRKP